MKQLKVAYVHDWLVVNGGAEKVAQGILEIFPEADVFSLIDFLGDQDREDILLGKKAKTTFIQKLPFAKKFYRYYLPLFPFAIEQLDLRGYDLIISSSYSVAKGVLTTANQIHISYCHSPVRYAWDLYFDYLDDQKLKGGFKAWYIKKTLHKLRQWDFLAAQRVDYFIANSENVAKRIQKTYRRDTKVIYPPIDIEDFKPGEEKKSDFYVTASRMVPYKRIDIIIEAFNRMPDKKLMVLGDGPEFKKLKKMANSNVQLLGHCSHDDLINYFRRAQAFIFAAQEDFGIVPVEAIAAGTPVIAYGKGGALETVNETTGVFFYEQNAKSIVKAVGEFEGSSQSYDLVKLQKHAEKFSKHRFKEEFTEFVNTAMDYE